MTILISGATEGIGWAIAQKTASNATHLIMLARDNQKLKDRAVAINKISKAKVHLLPTDLANPKKIEAVITKLKTLPLPDVWINNAGAYLEDTIFAPEYLQHNLQINFLAHVQLLSPFLTDFKTRKSGHIINILSRLSNAIRPNSASYTIAKHAAKAWSALVWHSIRDYNIKVTDVYPSSTYTASWKGSGVAPEKLIASTEIADAVAMAIASKSSTCPRAIHFNTLNKKYE